MKKIIIIILIVAVAAVTFFSCRANIDGTELIQPEDGESVTVRFVNSWGGVDSNADALDGIFRNFMQENPDITIINDSVGGSDFLNKIKTDFATNNDPDVFGLWPGSDINTLIEAGKIADLTDLINSDPEWKASFGEDAWNYCTVDGRIYGLPVEIIYEALFVNTQILDKYKLDSPQTYTDLCVLIRVLHNQGIVPIAYNYEAEGSYIYQNIVAQLMSEDNGNDFEECLKEGMYYMLDLYERYAFPENAYSLSNTQRNDLFLSGEAAMIVQGSWFTRDIYSSGMGAKVDIIPFPALDDSKSGEYSMIYGLGCGTFYISQKAWEDESKKEACIRVLRDLTSIETSDILSEESGFLSNIDMKDNQKGVSTLRKKGIELIEGADHLVPPIDSIIDRDLWEEVIVDEFSEIYRFGNSRIERLWRDISVDY